MDSDRYLSLSDTTASTSAASITTSRSDDDYYNNTSDTSSNIAAPGTGEALVPIESIPRCRDFAFDASATSSTPSPSSCYFGARASKVLKEQMSKDQLSRQSEGDPSYSSKTAASCAARPQNGQYVCVKDEAKLREMFGEDAHLDSSSSSGAERKPITWKTKVFNPLRILRENQN